MIPNFDLGDAASLVSANAEGSRGGTAGLEGKIGVGGRIKSRVDP
jgi:hypothetical protein